MPSGRIDQLAVLVGLTAFSACGGRTPLDHANHADAAPDVPAANDPLAIGAGGQHSCALLAGGEVWCWGNNDRGQLGDDTSGTRPHAGRVPGIARARALSVGAHHTCVITAERSIRCWGQWNRGPFGDGPGDERRFVPTHPELAEITTVATGWAHACAIAADGHVSCWGDNATGELGDGSVTSRDTTSVVDLPEPITQVAVAADSTCALGLSGRLWCWGIGAHFDDRTSLVPVPTPIVSARSLEAGLRHFCAVLPDAATHCWGFDRYDTLGVDHPSPGKELFLPPAPVRGLPATSTLATLADHTCALSDAGLVHCWGPTASASSAAPRRRSAPSLSRLTSPAPPPPSRQASSTPAQSSPAASCAGATEPAVSSGTAPLPQAPSLP
jgi:alpha-tubulin suppressor-like RCC1 family protein